MLDLSALWRRWQSRPVRVLLLVVSLVLGSLGTTLSLAVIQGRRSSLLPDDVFRVVLAQQVDGGGANDPLVNLADLPELRRSVPSALAVTPYYQWFAPIVQSQGQLYRIMGIGQVGLDWPQILPFNWVEGAFWSRENDGVLPAVISQDLARQLFPNGAQGGAQGGALGRPLTLTPSSGGAGLAVTVVGVYASLPRTLEQQAPLVFIPASSQTLNRPTSVLLVRARPGRLNQAREEVRVALSRMYSKDSGVFIDRNLFGSVIPQEILPPEVRRKDTLLYFFITLGILMLTAALIAVFAVQLVTVGERSGEVAMRRALGASHRRMVGEFGLESWVLGVVCTALGVALAHFALAPLSSLTGEMLFSRGLQLDPSSVVLPLLLFPVLSTLSASIPVMLGLRGGLVHALKTA